MTDDLKVPDRAERSARKKAEEAEAERLEVERLQQAYLRRTGRTEMKP